MASRQPKPPTRNRTASLPSPPATGFTTRADKVPTVATQIRMDADLYEAFRLACFRQKQSMSYVIEGLVRQWVVGQP